MAIPFDLSEIEARLDAMATKKERLDYLRKYLFEVKKQWAEFNLWDAHELDRLKPITQADFEKYLAVFDGGKIISLSPPNDPFHADKFQNIGLLRKRINLEHRANHLQSIIQLFQSRYELERERPGESKYFKKIPETFEDLFTSPYWADCFRYVLENTNPPLINDKNELKPPHGTKGIIPIVLIEIHQKRGLQNHTDEIRVLILNKTFPLLKLSRDASEFRKSYKRLDEMNVQLDVQTLISRYLSHFPKPENPGK